MQFKQWLNKTWLAIKSLRNAEWLSILFPLVLLLPNVVLNFTENYSLLVALANIIMPLGAYMLLMSRWRRVGWVTLGCLPLMSLAFGQIVQLYVYGESIMSVDMFLSVAASNVSEASELMGNLILPAGLTSLLYISFVFWAIVGILRKWRLNVIFQRYYRLASMWVAATGFILVVACYTGIAGYNADIHIFPVNVSDNLVTAFHRAGAALNYHETSAGFKYDAKTTHDSIGREVYVLVMGETARANNWQLVGYERETNPKLSKKDRLVSFSRALSQSNTTHKCVPMLLTGLSTADYDSINYRKGIITAFKEAGFYTTFVSNQRRNRSYIEYFAEEADNTVFLGDDGKSHLDGEMVSYVSSQLVDTTKARQLIILHAYGSHFNYRDRYSEGFRRFKPDETLDANWLNRGKLLNAYDNSILYTDDYLARIMDMVEHSGYSGAVIYVSDHGEDIFDDERNRFLHSSPIPTAYQIHVPFVVWLSSSYNASFPGQIDALEANRDKFVAATVSPFHTLIDLAGLEMSAYNEDASLASLEYVEPEPVFLTDRNETVPLEQSGLKPQDLQYLRSTGVLK